MADSIARQFARWAANLKYEDLPPEVVDKVKSLILVHLVSAVHGAQSPAAKKAVAFVKREEGKADGATIIWDGGKATRIGATFANSEEIRALEDSYRMITHPGKSLIPAALVNAELEGKSLKEMITALAAGYEFHCRLAYDFVPAVAARGYRPAPIFHTMGAAVVAAKLMDLDEERMKAAIAIAADCASGLFQSGTERGGGEGGGSVHDTNAARQGVFAAMVAREGDIKGPEYMIEGPAGFYNAFTGNNKGVLQYKFDGPSTVDLADIPKDLGRTWKLLTIMYRMYSTGGYNHQVINLLVELRERHKIDPDEIAVVEVLMNYLETLYPSPNFPGDPDNKARVGSTHYFAAHAIVNGGYPQLGGRTYGPTGDDLQHDQRVLDFMNTRVKVIGMYDKPMFSPSITVKMRDGRSYSGDYPYERMQWNFDGLVERLQDLRAKFPLGPGGLDALIEAMRSAEQMPSVAPLFALTRPR